MRAGSIGHQTLGGRTSPGRPRQVDFTSTKVPRFAGVTSWEQYRQVFDIQYLFSKISTINNTFNTIFDTYIFRSLMDRDSLGCLPLCPEYIITIIIKHVGLWLAGREGH